MGIQFLTNAAGEYTAVLVPIAEWEHLQQRLQGRPAVPVPHDDAAEPTKEQLKEDLREAVRELKLTLEGKLPKRSMQDFLQEMRADV